MNSNSGPNILAKKAKLPKEEENPAVTKNDESSPKVNDKAIGTINIGQIVDSIAAVKGLAFTRTSFMKNVGQYMLSTAVGLSRLSRPLMLDLKLSSTLCLWDNLAALNLYRTLC
ncbi:hypothetical protein Asppvi_004494 [Aspergillus pseudoviridinutans]|uniref:Uncharacterized protein n=1 Tax=Aspergillus pseudoviridinutans TaxID=1517512 RepID=A0A9P3BAG5_9EURO|nr:uncharacterized protein Asppvi_004494 [Aspergillus pseudoviridinutans]GIJ85633.1 hypothetical protein Asppvi_004494 [Aspergillus pseudoviridinutans]